MESQHVCSEMITVCLEDAGGGKGKRLVAILEEISSSSACIQLETPIPTGTRLRLVCSGCDLACEFHGKAVDCRYREGVGYYADVQFEPGSEWCADRYRPEHLLDLRLLAEHAAQIAPGPKCCPGNECKRRLMARVLEPELCLVEKVRNAGEVVSEVCRGMDRGSASKCFFNLLHIPPQCSLFDEFLDAYSDGQKVDREPRVPSTAIEHAESLALLVSSIPEQVLEL